MWPAYFLFRHTLLFPVLVQLPWNDDGVLQTLRASNVFFGKPWYDSAAVVVAGSEDPGYCKVFCMFNCSAHGDEEEQQGQRRKALTPEEEDAVEPDRMFALVRWYEVVPDAKVVAGDLLHEHGNVQMVWKSKAAGGARRRRMDEHLVEEQLLDAAQAKGYSVIRMKYILRQVFVMPDCVQGDGYFHLSTIRYPGSFKDSRTIAQIEGEKYYMGIFT